MVQRRGRRDGDRPAMPHGRRRAVRRIRDEQLAPRSSSTPPSTSSRRCRWPSRPGRRLRLKSGPPGSCARRADVHSGQATSTPRWRRSARAAPRGPQLLSDARPRSPAAGDGLTPRRGAPAVLSAAPCAPTPRARCTSSRPATACRPSPSAAARPGHLRTAFRTTRRVCEHVSRRRIATRPSQCSALPQGQRRRSAIRHSQPSALERRSKPRALGSGVRPAPPRGLGASSPLGSGAPPHGKRELRGGGPALRVGLVIARARPGSSRPSS